MNINQKFMAQRDSQNKDDGVIPLINVVFLMLIFFMVAGHIQKADPIQITPPNSINEQRAEQEPNVMLVIGPQGEAFLNDKPVLLDDIEGRLSQVFNNSADQANFWIQIKADGNLSIEALRPFFSQIRAAGLTKVSIATQLGQGDAG